MRLEILRFGDKEAWLNDLAKDFHQAVNSAIAARGVAHVSLAGGSTPKAFYLRLNQESLPWAQIEWWLGDERWVPVTDSNSNEKMVRESLGKNQSLFNAHFHSWHPEQDSKSAAKHYEAQLREKMGSPPKFDLVLLGLGADGHTASLFPGSAALNEGKLFAVANEVAEPKSTRLTLTFPVLNEARQIWFLVQGMEKEDRIKQLAAGDVSIPSARIQAKDQKLYWLTGGA